MTSYAEANGHEVVNWKKELTTYMYYGGDYRRLNDLAYHWTTCACGQLDVAIDRKVNNRYGPEPTDATLEHFGCAFSLHVHRKEYPEALEVLRRIEARAKLILEGVI